MSIQTLGGDVAVELLADDRVRVFMPAVNFSRKSLPMRGDGEAINEELKIDKVSYRITALSVGNPHVVLFGDYSDQQVAELGPKIENHELFPRRTNVEFVQIISRTEVRQRTWERGAGETLACGTGASAVCVAGVLNGLTEKRILNHLSGGDLELEWAEDGYLYMTGPAVEVFSGEIAL